MSYYKMERGWRDSAMFGAEPYSDGEAFCWMIGEAAWEDCVISCRGMPVTLKRGQLYTSIRFMSVKFKWSKDRVGRFLRRITVWGAIVVTPASGQNLITICNYSQYQDGKDSNKDTNKDRVKDSNKDAPKDKQEELLRKTRKTRNKKEGDPPENANASSLVSVPDILTECVELYNNLDFPKCQMLSDKRKTALKARLDECGGIEGWKALLEKASRSRFLHGANDRGWVADFDFIIRKDKFINIMEGKYDDRKSTSTKLSTGDAIFAGFAQADIGN